MAVALTGLGLSVPSLTAGASTSKAGSGQAAAPAVTTAPAAVTGSGDNAEFDGEFTLSRLRKARGGRPGVVAVGQLVGTITDEAGDEQEVTQAVRWPIADAQGRGMAAAVGARSAQAATCSVLRLVLGPLDLNLLGLRIQLNRVVLNITGETGPGNLLGNLLCALAGLLDPGGTGAGALSGLLGLINGLLNGSITQTP